MKKSVFAVITALAAAPALAQGTQPYSYTVPTVAYTETNANYCPAGLQPVTGLHGISCGRPTMAGPGAAARPMPPAKPVAPVMTSAVTSPPPTVVYAPDTIMMGGN
ncbi:hypothetical protein [Celeribacter persicus]|uniref:Intersectin-EH binding protein Ibp1 n=1 Tax=Celeribacter persicus TaxID=1651082 RepID=A0A2T5HM73_9RHOB|nr:hypothetical protein [Celeribacter persicus]PTQ72681.1 hypothetical protein C8N42_106191 [Celeribacter persicus]